MNGKKAKMLRRIAREQTAGLPEKEYEGVRLNPEKAGVSVQLIPSTRFVYKELKRAYKRGK